MMIRYMPILDSFLWAKKSLEYFDTVDELKTFIADQRTRFCRFIGRPDKSFRPDDVTLMNLRGVDPFMKWTHCCNVIIDGITVGFCGE